MLFNTHSIMFDVHVSVLVLMENLLYVAANDFVPEFCARYLARNFVSTRLSYTF